MNVALPIMQDGPREQAPPAAGAAARAVPGRLIDAHRRVIRDLRLSVTDRCNFRCVYCMDPDFRYMPKRELLSLEEYLTVAHVARSLGITKLRLTGGEPTLYPQLDALLAAAGRMGFDDLAITTNGSQLDEKRARQWVRLGLHRITFSLDSLDDERVRAITRTKSTTAQMVRAIEAAHAAGLRPIKVNAVVIRGINDDELCDFADFAQRYDIDYRFIEFMPLDSSRAWTREHVVSAEEMLERLRERHELVRDPGDARDSTSMNYTFAGSERGRIGIIAPVTRPFCGACSRLRITADGKVRPCLFSRDEWDLRPVLRPLSGRAVSDEEIANFIIDAVWTKQAGHGIGAQDFVQPARTMSAIGG